MEQRGSASGSKGDPSHLFSLVHRDPARQTLLVSSPHVRQDVVLFGLWGFPLRSGGGVPVPWSMFNTRGGALPSALLLVCQSFVIVSGIQLSQRGLLEIINRRLRPTLPH